MNTDPRFLRSQEKLHSAIIELVSDVRLEKISVTAIANKANVHRSTVYEHAQTPAQLLRQALFAELDELHSQYGLDGTAETSLEEGTSELLKYLKKRESIFSQMDDEAGAEIRNILRSHFMKSLVQVFELEKIEIPSTKLQIPEEDTKKFVVSALAGVHVSIFEAALTIDEDLAANAVSEMIKLTSPYWLKW